MRCADFNDENCCNRASKKHGKISANRALEALFIKLFVTKFGDIVAEISIFKVDTVKCNKH